MTLHYWDALHLQFYTIIALAAKALGHFSTMAVSLRQARAYCSALHDNLKGFLTNPLLQSLLRMLSLHVAAQRAIPMTQLELMEASFILEYMKGVFMVAQSYLFHPSRRGLQLMSIV
ncbi:MAG: hypothetical protein EZS28_007510 [Streblomastix strix]|uniref:Uncharacterized protein n=1 Tax=Streblomastix strix TaxID=222440 RepID=A0A5J4WQV8_9EUKA|nr:MAG: hypothetical protein EZS28_007510 [Streblomastix strix]